MVSATGSVLSAPVITVYVRHHKDCAHSDDHFYKGKGCNCRKRLRWTQNGKRRDVSAKTRAWAEAEKVKQKLIEKFEGTAPAPAQVETESRVTLLEAKERFLRSKRHSEEAGEAVCKKYDREIERLTTFLANRQKFFPNEITTDDAKAFQAGWLALYPSKQTRRRVLTRYRAFLRYCMDSDWLEKMPKFDKIPKDRADETRTQPLTPEQYEALLDTVPVTFTGTKAQRVRAIIQLMRHSGLAIHDAVTLERTELHHTKHVHRVITNRQKTGTHINVPIPPDVAKELIAVPNDNKKYFFWNTGEGKSQSAVTNWQHDLREVFRASGMPDGHPHMLRDTFAVRLLEKGVPMEEVSKALGHGSIKTTEKFYNPWIKTRQERLDGLVIAAWD
jgi:integrase/recombinase XerD